MVTDARLSNQVPKSSLSWKSFLLRARVPFEFARICVIATLLALVYLNQNSQVSNLVYEIQVLNAKRQILCRENAEVRYEIAVAESLFRIEEKAVRLGLADTVAVQRLEVSYAEEGPPEKSLPPKQLSSSVPTYLTADARGAWETLVLQFIEWVKNPRPAP